MNTDQLSELLVKRLEFMIVQHLPKPTCQSKQAEHAKLVDQVRRKVAHRLWPINEGVQVNISP